MEAGVSEWATVTALAFAVGFKGLVIWLLTKL